MMIGIISINLEELKFTNVIFILLYTLNRK